jgi:4-hydroxybenzoate polyprenyltransferase
MPSLSDWVTCNHSSFWATSRANLRGKLIPRLIDVSPGQAGHGNVADSALAVDQELGADRAIPLVVDLDQTLVLTDTLHEGFASLLFSDPLAALASLPSILHGRAAFKAMIAQKGAIDVTNLPFRISLLQLLRREKLRGRSIHLITAADQKIADQVAAHLDLFDGAIGSDGKNNLKAPRKLDYLRRQFPNGFIYAGDHTSDLPLFKVARGAILCDVNGRVAASARAAAAEILAEFTHPHGRLKVWLRAMRVHQWSKNILIFVPLIAAHAYLNPSNILAATAAFLIVCLLASATYMLNDLADLEADRLHESKRRRPFASGDLPIVFGLVVPPLLAVTALSAAYLLAPTFAAALALYLGLTLAYSFGLKKLALFDCVLISLLFMLRIVMGTEAIGIGYSPWLLSFSWAFFLSLALAKRHVEVARAADSELEQVAGRGYRGSDWPVTLAFGIGSGLVSIVIMLLYLTNDAMPSGFYSNTKWLYALPALVMTWLMHVWLLTDRMELDEDPVVFALKDPASLLLGVLTAIAFILAL